MRSGSLSRTARYADVPHLLSQLARYRLLKSELHIHFREVNR